MSQGPSGKKGAGAKAPLKGRNLVPIPLDLFNECRDRARVLEASRTPSTPANPVMEVCPYDKYHLIAAHKMSTHLEKCRMNYEAKMTKKGYKGARMTCKYNIRHQLLPPELMYHEARCDDRHYVPFYLLYVNPYFQDEKKKLRHNLEECKIIDPVELAKMHEGLFLDTVIGCNDPTLLPVPVENILNPEAAKERELLAKVAETKAKQVQAAEEAKRKVAVGGGGQPEAEMDEEERWWNESNGRKFDYMESVSNPKGPLWYKYPPGLSKARRRAFDKWNTQWMADILANAPEAAGPGNVDGAGTGEGPGNVDGVGTGEGPGNGGVAYDLVVLDDSDVTPSSRFAVAEDRTYAQVVKGSKVKLGETSNAGANISNEGTSEGTEPVASSSGGRRLLQKPAKE